MCGHGYLGRAVSRDFLAAGWRVNAVSQSGGSSAEPGLTELAADLSSRESIERLAASVPRPDFVVHCASSGRGGPDAYQGVYRDGCRHLLGAFTGVPLLFTSSSSVYAQVDGSVVTEESPAVPERETGRILREAESRVLDAGGFVFRLSGIYGPGRSVILRKFLAGEATIEEDGRRHLNQIHRDDAARAILRAAGGGLAPGIWNVSDSTPLPQIECYRALSSTFGRELPRSVPRDLNRKRGWTDKRVSNAKLVASGWSPAYPSFLDAAESVAASL